MALAFGEFDINRQLGILILTQPVADGNGDRHIEDWIRCPI